MRKMTLGLSKRVFVGMMSVIALVLSVSVYAFIEPGVNRPQMAWVTPDAAWRDIVDHMAQKRVRVLRMMLVPPLSKSVEIISYCNQKGIDVLVMVPLTPEIYYAPDVRRRIGNKEIYTVPPLSELGIEQFEKKWAEIMKLFQARGVSLSGIEVSNEFNSAVFNGDLPVTRGGAVVSNENSARYSFWPHYVGGMKKLVKVSQIMSTSLKANPNYKSVPLVLGGLARPPDAWIRSADDTVVEPSTTLKLLLELGIDRYIDAYAIHLYPQVPRPQWAAPRQVIRDYVEKRLGEVIAITGTRKPWWITEWGFAKQMQDTGCKQPDPRLPLFRAFLEVLGDNKYAHDLGPSFIYDWDESKNFYIWDGSYVLCADSLPAAFAH